MIGVFKECFETFIHLKNQLDKFEENNLINCKAKENPIYKMNLPKISDLKIPNFGNNIMKITSDFGFKTETLLNFTLLFTDDACMVLEKKENYIICGISFNDLLSQEIEHSISKMSSLFGTIIDELTDINNDASQFKEKMNNSKFQLLEQFFEYYFQKSIILADGILSQLRTELLNNIKNLIIIVLVIYIVLILFLFGVLFYFIYTFQKVLYSFLFFIAILPFQYLLEDNNLYNAINTFSNNYY